MDNLQQMLTKYLKKINGITYFKGQEGSSEVYRATQALAANCPSYLADVDEELYAEGQITCYNCRYRRWTQQGFSCYREFPVNTNQDAKI